jgi:biofilm PGA synthesis N-glycosyltransferase PgaC
MEINNSHKPSLSLIIPTYNEARYISEKLNNIYEEEYRHELLEIIVVDSASPDQTAELAKSWSAAHPDLSLRVIEESARRGKLQALLRGFETANPSSELILVTDADARWDNGAIQKVVKYFANPSIGVVTASLAYSDVVANESLYRRYYNIVRIAESKVHSTPIHSGVFQAIRAKVIREIGVPTFPGSDDSAFASYIAFAGYRSIQVEDIMIHEPMRGSKFLTKLRRAQHIVLNFLFTKRYAKTKKVYCASKFDRIWGIEFWLNVVNPWILIATVVLLVVSVVKLDYYIPLTLLLLASVAFVFKPYRMWISQQIYLVLGLLANLVMNKEIWRKG